MLAVYVGHLTGKGNDEDAKRMLAETGATFPAGFTTDAFVIEEYDLEAMPYFLFQGERAFSVEDIRRIVGKRPA